MPQTARSMRPAIFLRIPPNCHHSHFLSFFLSFSDLFLPTHCRYRALLLHLIILDDTHTLGRASLYEWLARRGDLYLTTHNTHNRRTYMPLAGFETVILLSERPQTHDLNRGAIEIACRHCALFNFSALIRRRIKQQ